MIGYVTLGTNDLPRAPLGIACCCSREEEFFDFVCEHIRVSGVAFAAANPCGAVLPDFPDRLRAAGIAEEDFKNVMQKCLDAEFMKITTLPIAILTGGIGMVLWCVPGSPCEPNTGMREFNEKYMPRGITCERLMIQGWVFDFIVPAVVVSVARDADPAEKLAQLKSLLEKDLISQADYEEKKAQILATM